MPDIAKQIETSKDDFTESLRELGYVHSPTQDCEMRYTSRLPYDGSEEAEVSILVPPDFPYQRPQAYLLSGDRPLSWHLTPEGALCLWPNDGSVVDLPWTDAVVFDARIRKWLSSTAAGDFDDLPILDLDLVIPATRGDRFVYDESDLNFEGLHYFKVRGPDQAGIYRPGKPLPRRPLPPSKKTRRGRRKHDHLVGAGVDIGELAQPFRSWIELCQLLPEAVVQELTEVLEAHVLILVVQYHRDGETGHVVLSIAPTSPHGAPAIRNRLASVSSSVAVRRLRGGAVAPSLRAKKVAVVGVGAVGSYVVDLLIRRGLSELTIVDGEDMRPGNSIRHLLADGACELTGKVEGVAKVVENYRFAPDLNIQPVHGHLRSVENARLLLESHDVVVDATASGEASALLADAASTEHPVVSVALQREGGVIRIDRYPASSRHPEVPVIETSRPIRVEAGCVDPVSPTTPDQVVEAAAWATRMTIDVLLKGSQFDSSIVIVTREQPDPPYDRLGFVSQEAAGQR